MLSEEQQQLVRAWCRSGHRVQVAVGRAGTGKTTTTRVAAEVWRHAGYRVIGCAVKGEAARHLAADARIDADTVALLLTRAGAGQQVLDGRTVLTPTDRTHYESPSPASPTGYAPTTHAPHAQRDGNRRAEDRRDAQQPPWLAARPAQASRHPARPVPNSQSRPFRHNAAMTTLSTLTTRPRGVKSATRSNR